jgi:hypothetical protein
MIYPNVLVALFQKENVDNVSKNNEISIFLK